MHSDLIKSTIFADFHRMTPHKFQNKTNGVTPRRWVAQCNRPLAALLTDVVGGDEWVRDFGLVAKLADLASDPSTQRRFMQVKLVAKQRLRRLVLERSDGDIDLDVNALFDVQVKRIHEYKRQLLNVLHVIHRYLELRRLSLSLIHI